MMGYAPPRQSVCRGAGHSRGPATSQVGCPEIPIALCSSRKARAGGAAVCVCSKYPNIKLRSALGQRASPAECADLSIVRVLISNRGFMTGHSIREQGSP